MKQWWSALITILSIVLVLSSCAQAPAPPNLAPTPSAPPTEPTPPPTQPPLTQSPNIIKAREALQSISASLATVYDQFGIDEDVADYVLFVSSLPTDFRNYALQNKLCIQDKKLSELEKQFLKEPDQYLQQMLDSYMTEIGTIDPGLADKLRLIPFLKEIEIKDVEALEDITSLAGRVEYRASVGKIYGKGIERTMHPVALEKLVWDCYSSELDEPDLSIHSRLADFQEKYNQQMDGIEPVEGKKPQVLGISNICEWIGGQKKPDDDIRFDYALMRWVLGTSDVKLLGFSNEVFDHVELAQEEGLKVWLDYAPAALGALNPDISVEDYCKQLAGFAQAAEEAKAEVLIVGYEVDRHLKRFDYQTGALRAAVDEMVKTARQNYHGLVTYGTWDGPFDVCNINWEPMDIIFPQIYKFTRTASNAPRELTDSEYLSIINKWKNKTPGKLTAIAEYGSLSVSEGAALGPCSDLLKTEPYHYDTQAQADSIARQLRVLFEADIYGIFLHRWDNYPAGPVKDWEQVGYGIWDWRSKEPKPSFWVMYKYYRER